MAPAATGSPAPPGPSGTTTVRVTAVAGSADLYPGFAGGDVAFTVANPDPWPLTFDSMTPGAISSDSPSRCPAGAISVAPATDLGLTLGPAALRTVSIRDVVAMAESAPDGCQGVTFTVALRLSGHRSEPTESGSQ
jgi:hypothetical protein